MSQRTIKLALGAALAAMGVVSLQAQQAPPPVPPLPPVTSTLKRPVPVPAHLAPAAPAVATPAAAPVPPVATNTGPRIQFAAPVYDFGKIKSGEVVKHTYTFTNTGDAVLELSNVQPQCGCTPTGEWTKRVEPGEAGIVPIQFNSANFHGQVLKTVTVACNDKTQPVVVLQLKGTLWKPIDFIPPYTVMNILPDMTNATATVRIVNNMEEPLAVDSPQSSNPQFAVELATNQPGKEYLLTLTALPPMTPGTIQGKVSLKTSATNTPVLDVPFWANVQAPVMVLPPQLMIPAAPLATRVAPTVTIQNNSTNVLTVTEPSVNIPGAEVQVKELQPGRIFSVQVNFPEGLELKPAEKPMLVFKTSHPQFAQVQVPIVQMPKPTPIMVPGAPGQLKPLSPKLQPAAQLVPAAKTAPVQPSQ